MNLGFFLKLKRKIKGAILIEFAFSIPVLSVVLFFMTDAPRYYYLKSKIKNSVYFAINMIQNITQFRKEKKINKTMLCDVFCTSLMNHYHALKLYSNGNNEYPLGHTCSAFVYCVRGEKEGAKVLWGWHNDGIGISPRTCKSNIMTMQDPNSLIKYHGSTASEIYKDLSINDGEIKIIVELGLVITKIVGSQNDSDDKKKRFGFLALPIKPAAGESYFNTVAIFTPKPQLFNEIPPE